MIHLDVPTTKYVNYNDSGTLLSITRKPDETLSNLKVKISEVEGILNGTEGLEQYIVEYDFLQKDFVLKKKQDWKETQVVNSWLHELPTKAPYYNICIEQNHAEKIWVLRLNQKLKKDLIDNKIDISNAIVNFSITEKNDPHKLLRILNFNTNDTIQDGVYYIPFENDFEFDKQEVSVYTIKKFSQYLFEVKQ